MAAAVSGTVKKFFFKNGAVLHSGKRAAGDEPTDRLKLAAGLVRGIVKQEERSWVQPSASQPERTLRRQPRHRQMHRITRPIKTHSSNKPEGWREQRAPITLPKNIITTITPLTSKTRHRKKINKGLKKEAFIYVLETFSNTKIAVQSPICAKWRIFNLLNGRQLQSHLFLKTTP